MNRQFLFGKFENGEVYYRDGRKYAVDLNYDIVNRQFLFIDKSDNNTEKAFAEPDMVTLVTIGERMFLHDPKDIKEVLQREPSILVQYKAKIRERGKRAGYGGYSETSAIDNISGIQSGGIYYKFEDENSLLLSRVDKVYFVTHDKKRRSFYNDKTFLKIYSKHRDTLRQYIKDQGTNFTRMDDVVKLCNYAFSLK